MRRIARWLYDLDWFIAYLIPRWVAQRLRDFAFPQEPQQ